MDVVSQLLLARQTQGDPGWVVEADSDCDTMVPIAGAMAMKIAWWFILILSRVQLVRKKIECNFGADFRIFSGLMQRCLNLHALQSVGTHQSR